jgi:hypothetical protein
MDLNLNLTDKIAEILGQPEGATADKVKELRSRYFALADSSPILQHPVISVMAMSRALFSEFSASSFRATVLC